MPGILETSTQQLKRPVKITYVKSLLKNSGKKQSPIKRSNIFVDFFGIAVGELPTIFLLPLKHDSVVWALTKNIMTKGKFPALSGRILTLISHFLT